MHISVIPLEGPVEEQDIPDDESAALVELQRIVGGFIDVYPVWKNVVCVFKDGGHPHDPTDHYNRRATILCRTSRVIEGEATITGPVAFVGHDQGRFVDIPPDVAMLLRVNR